MQRKRDKIILGLIVLFVSIGVIAALSLKSKDNICKQLVTAQIIKAPSGDIAVPFRTGEKFLYDIKVGLLKVGSAQLTFHGLQKLEGNDVYVITLETRAARIYDQETVYAAIDTFYPLKVERKLTMLGVPINIVENYDQCNKFVSIERIERGKKNIQTITSDKALQNIISLIYFYRNNNFKKDYVLNVNLPTKAIQMKVSDTDRLVVPKGKYEALLLESIPKQYKVWFDVSEDKIPLRIEGTVALTGAAMVLRSIQ